MKELPNPRSSCSNEKYSNINISLQNETPNQDNSTKRSTRTNTLSIYNFNVNVSNMTLFIVSELIPWIPSHNPTLDTVVDVILSLYSHRFTSKIKYKSRFITPLPTVLGFNNLTCSAFYVKKKKIELLDLRSVNVCFPTKKNEFSSSELSNSIKFNEDEVRDEEICSYITPSSILTSSSLDTALSNKHGQPSVFLYKHKERIISFIFHINSIFLYILPSSHLCNSVDEVFLSPINHSLFEKELLNIMSVSSDYEYFNNKDNQSKLNYNYANEDKSNVQYNSNTLSPTSRKDGFQQGNISGFSQNIVLDGGISRALIPAITTKFVLSLNFWKNIKYYGNFEDIKMDDKRGLDDSENNEVMYHQFVDTEIFYNVGKLEDEDLYPTTCDSPPPKHTIKKIIKSGKLSIDISASGLELISEMNFVVNFIGLLNVWGSSIHEGRFLIKFQEKKTKKMLKRILRKLVRIELNDSKKKYDFRNENDQSSQNDDSSLISSISHNNSLNSFTSEKSIFYDESLLSSFFEKNSSFSSDFKKSSESGNISNRIGENSNLFPQFYSLKSSPNSSDELFKSNINSQHRDKAKSISDFQIPSFSLLENRNLKIDFVLYISPPKIALLINKKSIKLSDSSSDTYNLGFLDDGVFDNIKFKVPLSFFIFILFCFFFSNLY
jgi:hypothetical protein